MSDVVNIALVAEGVTDYEVLNAAVESMLGDRRFDLKLFQPEGSVAFTGAGNVGPLGGGWKGVYQWCRQSTERAEGKLSDDALFLHYDLLVIHLDADVASEAAGNALADSLPCEEPCPPASATTNRLRQLMIAWIGEEDTPPKTVLCTPSKNTEAWVMAMLFPDDSEMAKQDHECHPTPQSRLGQQKRTVRISKTRADYQARAAEFKSRWPAIVQQLSEARRFNDEFLAAVPPVPV